MAEPQLKQHQQRVVDRLTAPDSPHGLIAYHSLGSGKTLTALGALDKVLASNPKQRGLFVVPASLQDNVRKEIDKHGFKNLKRKVDIVSYERAANHISEYKKKPYALTVFDEAHRLRNSDSKRVSELQKLVNKSPKVLMLTGTVGYNHPANIASLINMINPQERLPDTPKAFNSEFINDNTWKLKNTNRLSRVLNRYIDRYKTPQSSDDFPSVTRKIIEVEMSPKQQALYKTVERSIPAEIRLKLQKNLPLSLKDASRLNVFSQGVRQVSNATTHHNIKGTYKDSPKILTAVNHMVNAAKSTPGFRGIAYSNYIDAGLQPYERALEDNGIKPLVFTGALNAKEKKELVDEYNSKSLKPKVLLLSSSGGEGLDLKRTRLMQLLEPHFNKSKLDQAEGRAIRYKSHADLPAKDRHVLVEEYRSQLPKTLFQRWFNRKRTTAIDDYLSDLSLKKQNINKQIDDLLITG